MLENLLENWLDSASEKSYQPSFVQMLAAQGYCVLHSSRHCALEFGKDVIAIAPDGTPCAFQLKGNPGKKGREGEGHILNIRREGEERRGGSHLNRLSENTNSQGRKKEVYFVK